MVLATFAVSACPKTARFRADEILSTRAGLEIDYLCSADRRMIEVVERAVEQMRAEQLTHPER